MIPNDPREIYLADDNDFENINIYSINRNDDSIFNYHQSSNLKDNLDQNLFS